MKSQFDYHYLEETQQACVTRDLFIHTFGKNYRKYVMIYSVVETKFLYVKDIVNKLLSRENHGTPFFSINRVARILAILALYGFVNVCFVKASNRNQMVPLYKRKEFA